MQDSDHNNFSLGFVVGALTGVAGYFLTKTKEGKEIKNKVAKEWETIRKKLEDEGVISSDGQDFPDVIFKIRTKIFEILKEDPPKKKRKASGAAGRGRPKSKTNEKTGSSAKKRKKLFKGI